VPQLELDAVHVWRVVVSAGSEDAVRYIRLLSSDERDRLTRFKRQKDRDHFVAARGVLRSLLGAYSDLDPSHVSLTYGSQGKPAFVLDEQNAISFNVSHSGGLILIACARQFDVGIDVEEVRAGRDVMSIAERYFPSNEASELRHASESRRDEVFFRFWTRKEALAKLRGDSIWNVLQIETLGPDARSSWQGMDMTPADGYVAHLVYSPGTALVRGYSWPGHVRGDIPNESGS
jgi:4'-phosphopantetheinyl transferase